MSSDGQGAEAPTAEDVIEAMCAEVRRVALPALRVAPGTLSLNKVEVLSRDGMFIAVVPGFHTRGGTPDPRSHKSQTRR